MQELLGVGEQVKERPGPRSLRCRGLLLRAVDDTHGGLPHPPQVLRGEFSLVLPKKGRIKNIWNVFVRENFQSRKI